VKGNTISIVFSGARDDGSLLAPDTISVTELLALLAPLEKAIKQTAGIQGRALSLVACTEGSSSNECIVAHECTEALQRVHEAIRAGDLGALPASAGRTLLTYRAALTRRRWRADLRLVEGGSAVIDEHHPLSALSPPALVKERRSLYGKVVKAGGVDATKFIHLEVLHKRTPHRVLPVDADEVLVKEVAARMFEVVHLAGVATYDVVNKQIVGFHAERLLPYRQTPPTVAFALLREAIGDAFADTDPIAFQRSVRDGGDV